MNSPTVRRLFLLISLLVFCSVIATGIYNQASKSQKKSKDHPRTYEAAKVTDLPTVVSGIKGLEITSVSGTSLITLQSFASRDASHAGVRLNDSESPIAESSLTNRLEAEVVTLTRSGFEPAEMIRPQGRFVLVVANRIGMEEMSLELIRENSGSKKTVRVPRKKLDWHEPLDLPPGTYLLRETTVPELICRIVVTPQ